MALYPAEAPPPPQAPPPESSGISQPSVGRPAFTTLYKQHVAGKNHPPQTHTPEPIIRHQKSLGLLPKSHQLMPYCFMRR